MRFLVIAAHPDDEILGCGASMRKWSDQGHQVDMLILSEGITSRDAKRDRSKRVLELNKLNKSSQIAKKIIGANSLKLLDFPDNRMDSIDLLDIIKEIEKHIKKIKPDILVTHFLGDLNVDHQIIHRATITAARPEPDNYVKKILCFEIPSSTEWQSTCDPSKFIPNWFEDITETLDYKIRALNAYENEMRDWPHPRSTEAIKSLAKWRGASVGLEAAEAFMLIKAIN